MSGGKGKAMDTLRSVAHLQRELGDELFAVLISSDNTAAIKEFTQKLIKAGIPTELAIAGRTYDIMSFLKGDEKSVVGHTMVERAKEMGAHLGADDGEHLLAHQDEIPSALRGKVVFVFTDWQHPADPECVYCVDWFDDRWFRRWGWLGNFWNDGCRVLRRKSAR